MKSDICYWGLFILKDAVKLTLCIWLSSSYANLGGWVIVLDGNNSIGPAGSVEVKAAGSYMADSMV